MFDEHIRNLELMIHNYQTSIANESIGDYDKIHTNDGLRLSERSKDILALVEKNPVILHEAYRPCFVSDNPLL